MSEPTPEIPGLGSDPNEPPIVGEAPPPEYATGLQPPGGEVTPYAKTWVDKYEYLAPPGTTGRLIAGTSSQLWIGTLPTGRIRFQVYEEASPTPIPPALPKIDDVTISSTVVVAGGEVTGEVDLTLPSPAGGTQVYLISSNPNVALVPTSTVTVPAGQLSVPFKVTTNPAITAPATVTITASANSSSDSATFGVQPKAPDPIPIPPAPTINAFVALPTSVQPSQPLTLSVSLSANVPAPITVQITTPWNTSTQVLIPQGTSAGQGTLVVPATAPIGQATLRAILGTSTRETIVQVVAEPVPIPPDPEPPIPIPPTPGPGPIPISRTIDLTGKTQSQIQAAISTAEPGTGLYLGPGLYPMPASVGGDGQVLDVLHRRGITIFGAGPSTVIDAQGKEGVWLRQGGNINEGNVIRDLEIRNSRRAVAALDPQRLWLSRVTMRNVSHGYASERTSAYDNAQYEWFTTISDCLITGWASHGCMLHGGEVVERCQIIDTPGNQGSTYSHGLYMQGPKSLTIRDVTIENASGHAWQLYSDAASHAANGAQNVLMQRVTCKNNFMGPIIAANGDYSNITIEDMTTVGTVSRNSATWVISATNSPIVGLKMKNIIIDGGGDAMALQSGQTGVIRGMIIDGLIVRNHSCGIRIGSSSTGWPYTRIESSRINGYQAPGVPLPVVGTSSGLVIT